MPTFKKKQKPITVEAIQYTKDNLKDVLEFTGKHPDWDRWFENFEDYEAHVKKENGLFKLSTDQGWTQAYPGDWIIRDSTGACYPCKAEVFEATYETEMI